MEIKTILITQRAEKDKYGCDIEVLESAYITFWEKFKVKLIAIPNSTSQIKEYFNANLNIHGVILSGGNDIDPKLYGGDDHTHLKDISIRRDDCENIILNIALERKLPVFGICRGLQFINVFFGGSLNSNINDQSCTPHPPGSNHTVIINNQDIGMKKAVTNSYHNQGVVIDGLAPDLKSFAVEQETGIVEGVYHPTLPVAGVQWHPEREKEQKRLDVILTESFLAGKLFWNCSPVLRK